MGEVKEKTFEIQESELKAIFDYIVQQPLKDTVVLYDMCQKISTRAIVTEDSEKGE